MLTVVRILAILFFLPFPKTAPDDSGTASVMVTVEDKKASSPLQGAVVKIPEYGLWAVTDEKGRAVIRKVPDGKVKLECSILGYVTSELTVAVPGPEVRLKMEEQSFSIEDVVVVATRDKNAESTISKIGRQAIDHLQATSVTDLLQLLPGNIVTSNPSLTTPSAFTNRTLDKYDSNNAFGASVMIDGVPVSNNADMNTKGGVHSTAGGGVDLRSIGTDDIESVEIVRGIPSAEYGDMSSGALIINSRAGISDLKLKAKIFPGVRQFYAGKGFKAGRAGSLNVNLDYADGKSDPRYTTDTYLRALASVLWTVNAGRNASFTTRLSTTNVRDWSGADPSEVVRDVWKSTRENGFTLTHSGKFSTPLFLLRNLKYDLSFSWKRSDSFTRTLVTGGQPLIDSRTEGTFEATMLPRQYYGEGGTIGIPMNGFAKIGDSFNLNTRSGRFKNRFNLGAEYRFDGNVGPGFTNANPALPLQTSPYRARAFKDIPFLHQIAAYAEDNFSISLSGSGEFPRIKGQAGVRWAMIQPGMGEQMSSLSPRLNISFSPFGKLSFRAGYGISEKVPSLLMLYPDVSWLDLMNVNASKGDKYLGVYTTRIFEHAPKDLRPMRSEKVELGVDFSLWKGSSFSLIAWRDDVSDGFSSRNDEWIPVVFNRWAASSVTEEGGVLVYDKVHPTVVDTTLFCNSRMSNTDVHVSKGVEFDFNLGKIRATGTSLFLSGAWAETEYWSSNEVYEEPRGSSDTYRKILFIYPAGARKNLNRSMTASLRVVQSIPAIAFVVSGTIQASLYNYSKNRIDIETPVAWQDAEGRHPVTAAQLADPSAVLLHGYSLADNIYPKGAYSDRAESWPSLWTVNLRVTKEVSRRFNLSFYVNNLLFSQPWQSSSISSTKVEKNSNFFSFGFEISLNL